MKDGSGRPPSISRNRRLIQTAGAWVAPATSQEPSTKISRAMKYVRRRPIRSETRPISATLTV